MQVVIMLQRYYWQVKLVRTVAGRTWIEVGGLARDDDEMDATRWSGSDDTSQFFLRHRRHVDPVDCRQNIANPRQYDGLY